MNYFPEFGNPEPECPSLEEARKRFVGIQYKAERGEIVQVIDGPRKNVYLKANVVTCDYTVEVSDL